MINMSVLWEVNWIVKHELNPIKELDFRKDNIGFI